MLPLAELRLIDIARWDGTSWSALGTGMNDIVYALAFDASGNLYAGGQFTTAGGVAANRIAKWDGTSWSALGTGMSSIVYALAFDASGNLYAGGQFTTAGGVAANDIAKWDGTSWSALGTGMNDMFMLLLLTHRAICMREVLLPLPAGLRLTILPNGTARAGQPWERG